MGYLPFLVCARADAATLLERALERPSRMIALAFLAIALLVWALLDTGDAPPSSLTCDAVGRFPALTCPDSHHRDPSRSQSHPDGRERDGRGQRRCSPIQECAEIVPLKCRHAAGAKTRLWEGPEATPE